MIDSENAERGLQTDAKGDYKKAKPRKICVKVYFNPKTFQAIAQDAEKAGKRRGGLQLFTQKPHGFANETLANTDGISKFLKHCWQYWKETEAQRLEAAADLRREEQDIQEKKKKLGIA